MKQISDTELLRYSRTIFLDSVDYAGQVKLANSKVLIVGVGGLGSAASLYLASSGIGKIYLSDDDVVEVSNLARQIIHFTADIGKKKTNSAKEKLHALNPEIQIKTLGKMNEVNLESNLDMLNEVDVVLDCSDNFETRFLINRFCKLTHTPLVSGSALRFEGQVLSFLGAKNSPCYQCLFPNLNDNIPENCLNCGVFPPLVGIIGSIQAAEAMKIILKIGVSLENRMLNISAFEMKFREIKLNQDPSCPICFANDA